MRQLVMLDDQLGKDIWRQLLSPNGQTTQGKLLGIENPFSPLVFFLKTIKSKASI